MKRVNKQKGFTIIELVVVILLLGILTATALPRFMDVSVQAHGAINNAVLGSMRTGVALFHAAYIAQGQPAADSEIAGFGNGDLITNDTGYPVGFLADAGALDSDACANVYEGLMQTEAGAPTVAAKGTTVQPTVAEVNAQGTDYLAYVLAASPTVCRYVYTGIAVTGASTPQQISFATDTGIVSLGTTPVTP